MKQTFVRTLTVLMLALMAMGIAASAQSAPVVKVTIPFAFNFGDQTFPAGAYTLIRPLENVMALRDSGGRVIAQRLVDGVDSITPADVTKLKFESVDGQYVLTEVWRRQESSGLRLLPTKHVTNVAKQSPAEVRETVEGSQP